MSTKQFDLIIPVLNEAEALPGFFSRLQKLQLNCQPIFINNASTDNSLDLINDYPGAIVINHNTNEGYGSSIIDGIAASKNDVIVIIDVDGEYPPECIPVLLEALRINDIVYASRFLHSQIESNPDISWPKKLGNQLITHLFNQLFHQNITDLYTGCKAIKRSCLLVLELSAKLAARNYKIAEIPVYYQRRRTGKSKMHHIPETVKYFYWLLRYARQLRAGKL